MITRRVRGADGVELACQLSGDPSSPPMVLLHALGEQIESWDAFVEAAAASFHVAAFDLRGHGASEWPGTYTYELMRDDILRALDELGMREIVLVGHSLGGAVAYLIAQAQPARVSRLIIEDAVPPYPRDRPVPQRPDGPLPFDWAVLTAVNEQTNDPSMKWWPGLRGITAPTLLIGGGPSSHIPADLLTDVADAIPDCTLVTIDAGHHVHISRPAEFAETVLDWLGRTPPANA